MSAGESYMVPSNDASELSNPIARAYYSLSEKGRTVVMVVGTVGVCAVVGIAAYKGAPVQMNFGDVKVGLNCI